MAYRNVARLAGRGPGPGQFSNALRGLALDPGGDVVAVGDAQVQIFSADGELQRRWTTGRSAHAVAVDETGRIWVGEPGRVEIFGPSGEKLDVRRDEGRLGLVTAIDFHGGDVFLADAGARWIRRYGADGRFRNDIGDRHRKGGFHIPNGVVDFVVDPQGILHVANPGMHRVERWTADGELLDHFGRFDGRDPAGFPGCCNPTNVTLDGHGRVIVSEKAGPRAKIYTPAGELVEVIADGVFDPAAKNMDVVATADGRVLVADTATLEILVFAPVAAEVAA